MPGYDLKKLGRGILDRAKRALKGRKKMSTARQKMKRAYSKEGEAGEKRSYKVDRKSPVGKLQRRNKRMKDQLDQLD